MQVAKHPSPNFIQTRHRLGRLLCAAFLSFLVLAFLLHLSVPTLAQTLSVKLTAKLAGFSKDSVRKDLTIETVIDGTYQEAFEKWWAERIPIRSLIIKFNNQMDYWIFEKATIARDIVVIGKSKVLYEKTSVLEVFGHIPSPTEQQISTQLEKLERLHAYLESKNIPFIFVITPSKPAIYPEYVPQRYKTLTSTTLAPMRFYNHLISGLEKTAIPYIDGHAALKKQGPLFDVSLFTRGSFHWNALGSFLITKEIVQSLSSQKPETSLDVVLDNVSYHHTPSGRDRDLVYHSNLLIPNDTFITPEISTHLDGTPFTKKAILVGNSFSEDIMQHLMANAAYSQVDRYFYYSQGFQTCAFCPYSPIDRSSIDWAFEFSKAASVIVELNEYMGEHVGENGYLTNFLDDALRDIDKGRRDDLDDNGARIN